MQDSTRRLEVLSGLQILDTPPEPEFDDIVQIARRVCQTPVALISLVAEDRQWFKARVGFEACETPLAQSVCAHALTSDDLFIIPDLTQDSRTAGNALVTGEPFIRFYAGAPLMTPEGVAIGSLCVIDTVVRPEGLTRDQAETMRALARQTMTVMGLRKAMLSRDTALAASHLTNRASLDRALASEATSDRLRDAEALFRGAQEAARVGAFEVDITTNHFQISLEFCRIFGLPDCDNVDAETLEDLILLQDRGIVASSRATRADGTAAQDVEYRIRRQSDGALRWISRRGAFDWDAEGNATRMLGVVQDITARKLIEAKSEALISLGDQLRGATSTFAAGEMAGTILGNTLAASRAGYGLIDETQGTYLIERDWTAPGTSSISGSWPLSPFEQTIDLLRTGAPFVVANVPAAKWLDKDAAGYASIETAAQVNIPLVQNDRLVGVLFAHNATPRTWTPAEVEFAVNVADRTYAAIAKLKAEEHQRVLNEELSHRLKNTMSMVQAIVTQTLRGITDREVVKTLENRIIALSKAHDVLLQETWTAAPVANVIQSVMQLHGRGKALDAAGPDVTLGPKATLAFSLLLHELVTNSIKYGALSAEAGRVALDWTIDHDGAEPALKVTWIEQGGPPTVAPTRKGFGSRLISMGLGAGSAQLDYKRDGLHALFVAPLRLVSSG